VVAVAEVGQVLLVLVAGFGDGEVHAHSYYKDGLSANC
jgi:hypothetical protein